MSGFRIDTDSLGEIRVPIDAYFGPFTARAMKIIRLLVRERT